MELVVISGLRIKPFHERNSCNSMFEMQIGWSEDQVPHIYVAPACFPIFSDTVCVLSKLLLIFNLMQRTYIKQPFRRIKMRRGINFALIRIYSLTSIARAPIIRVRGILKHIGYFDYLFFVFLAHILAVGAIFKSQNHPKCEFISHSG